MKTELDRVAHLLDEASESLSAGKPDDAGNQLSEARGILEQVLEAAGPAAIKPVVPAANPEVATIKRKYPAA